uniref:Uncharacterized protein n=1 Tax=Meloidogyne incognita TaxID=6306 RepID=A0A914NWS3_MELIC
MHVLYSWLIYDEVILVKRLTWHWNVLAMMICQMKMMTMKKIWMRQATISRTRENSNTSFSARERTISEQSRRRQENATGLDESLDEHEGEDAYGSDHDDIDDDDDDDDDGEGEVHGGSDVNQLDLIWIQRFLAFLRMHLTNV